MDSLTEEKVCDQRDSKGEHFCALTDTVAVASVWFSDLTRGMCTRARASLLKLLILCFMSPGPSSVTMNHDR